MEKNYTIPINLAFEAGVADKKCGCPLCSLYRTLEENQLDTILGGAMMEPDVRIKTNEEGFCKIHYDMLLGMKNRLSMALTLESHLIELQKELNPSGLSALLAKPIKRVAELDESCYVCSRVNYHFARMTEVVISLWKSDENFRKKFDGQPYFCLPHYRKLVEVAEKMLSKKDAAEFRKNIEKIVNGYLDELASDVSWFCKKFDYRYEEEPWYNSKDSVERAVIFLRSDLHRSQKDKTRNMGGLS